MIGSDNIGTARERHAVAMDIAEQAFALKDKSIAPVMFTRAYLIEKSIAENIPAIKENEPSRAILYRSAASLALNAGMLEEAKNMALEGLSGHPPSCVAQELFDVYREVIKNQ